MEALLGIGIFIIVIVVLRLLGAWMLRINEVISLQKEMIQEIKKLRATKE